MEMGLYTLPVFFLLITSAGKVVPRQSKTCLALGARGGSRLQADCQGDEHCPTSRAASLLQTASLPYQATLSLLREKEGVNGESNFPLHGLARKVTSLLSGDGEEDEAAQKAMLKEMADFPEACRRFVQFTWAPGLTNEPVFPVGVEDLAIAMISGREEFFSVSFENVLKYAPRGMLIRANGMCACSFRAALRVLRARHPDAKWYFVGDDDSILDLDSLVQLLSQFDPSHPTIVSSNGGHHICDSCGACPSVTDHLGNNGGLAFYGGTGQLMSAGLVKEMESTLDWTCLEAIDPTLEGFGDLENTCNMAGRWQPDWRFVRLLRNFSTWFTFQRESPQFFVAHHLCAPLLSNLSHINQAMPVAHQELLIVDNADNAGCKAQEPATGSTQV